MTHHSPNFLTPVETKEPPKEPVAHPKKTRVRAHRPHIGRWMIVLICFAFVVAIAPAGYACAQAFASAQSAKAALNRVKDDVQRMDLVAAQQDMLIARAALGEARDALQGVGFWRDVPGIGIQIRALEDAAAAGAQTLDGIGDALHAVEVVTDALRNGTDIEQTLQGGIAPTRTFDDLSPEEKRDLLAKFSNSLSDIRLSRDKIDLALELWNRVPQSALLAPIRIALKPVAESLPKLAQALDQGVPLLETMIPLAGYPQRINYLVLLQNADELRPGGGFIGNVGTVSFDAGEMSELHFEDVYAVDNPASGSWSEIPPRPIAEQLNVKNWYLRDANWSPDFPTSAARVLDFYTREREIGTGKRDADPPTAVLALQPGIFKALLHLTGPITVEGKTFTEDNFFDQIQYEVEQGFLEQGIAVADRKDLIGKIGDELAEKLKALPVSRWNEIIDIVTKALEQKQILVYTQNASLLRMLDARGWTGRTRSTRGDFVWVIDANLAALKTDGMMTKRVAYALDARDPEHPTVTVTLAYTNKTQKIDWRYTRYRSYTRVYVPEGAELVSSKGTGRVDVTKELGKTVFGTFWVIEPGKTGTMSFTYALPPSTATSIQEGSYILDWPKQIGADETQLTVNLLFGKTVRSATPAEARDKWGDAQYEYTTDSLVDRVFSVSF